MSPAREERLAQKRAYYAANRERIREQHKAYYAENSDEMLAQQKAYRERNPERMAATKRAHYDANREEIAEYYRVWLEANRDERARQQAEYYKANRETRIANTLAWREANPEAYRAQAARRRALKKDAQGGDVSPAMLAAMYESQQGLCAYCECELNGDYHVEHMTPLSRGGAHDWSNIALACPTCNLRKNAKTVDEVMEFLYRNELMGEEERLQLRDRIRRLKRKLETAAETVDAIHSGLERMES